jgi:hypothetical protein
MSSSIRFIRIEVSGTAVIYTLMFHYVNHSLVIPLTDYSHVDPIILVFVSMECYCLDKSSFLRIPLRSRYFNRTGCARTGTVVRWPDPRS